jgi:hypothetical protein
MGAFQERKGSLLSAKRQNPVGGQGLAAWRLASFPLLRSGGVGVFEHGDQDA